MQVGQDDTLSKQNFLVSHQLYLVGFWLGFSLKDEARISTSSDNRLTCYRQTVPLETLWKSGHTHTIFKVLGNYQNNKNLRYKFPGTREARISPQAFEQGLRNHRKFLPVWKQIGRSWILQPTGFQLGTPPWNKASTKELMNRKQVSTPRAKAKLWINSILLWLKVIFTYLHCCLKWKCILFV